MTRRGIEAKAELTAEVDQETSKTIMSMLSAAKAKHFILLRNQGRKRRHKTCCRMCTSLSLRACEIKAPYVKRDDITR